MRSDPWAWFRAQFPALERHVWLNTPVVPPAATPVVEALARAQRAWLEGDFDWHDWEASADHARAMFAAMIGAGPESVAVLGSLAEAAATVAASLPPGRVVVGADEFRSNLFPWLSLEERGWQVVSVPAADEALRTADLVQAVDETTTLVAVSAVQSSSGRRLQMEEVARRCREVGARLFVNLTQMAGALRFDVREVPADFVAAHGYKWLLSPRGAAWLYVRPDRLQEVQPLMPSWKSGPRPLADYYGGPLELAPAARRLDASIAWLSWVGAEAALGMLGALDGAEAERRCLGLAASFREGCRSLGLRLVPEEAPSHIASIVLTDPETVVARLAERRVRAAVRGGFLRLGFHAFNDDADVEACLAALARP